VTDQELTTAIREVRERARVHAPEGPLGVEGVNAPDLMPLLRARDAAEAKVAAIGTVNPRPPGLKNSIAQGIKRWVARALDWHVREQVEFNRASIMCVQATLEALTAATRNTSILVGHYQETQRQIHALRRESQESHQALRSELQELRRELQVAEEMRASLAEFEQRAISGEIRVLRTISELQVAYQYRLNQLELAYQQRLQGQHRDYQDALDRRTEDIQKRLWEDLAKVRQEFERLIHYELRLARQKPGIGARVAPAAGSVPEDIPIDWQVFARRFRGSEERIRGQQARYIAHFAGTTGVILDLGCGRGEFLEAAREAGITAYGIEMSQECVDLCRSKGLDAECADMFAYLEAQPDGSVSGVYCAQVVEHISPPALARLIALLGRKLRTGAKVAIETPNPECLAIFATHFYIDPTHTRPVPAALLRFYLEEAGCGAIQVEYLEPASESLPAVNELPAVVKELFFGGLDYAILATKL
jgi:O-antigen chain-terminating methyltransferase